MNNALQVFDYNGSAVRTVNKDGEIWFVAKDVCDVLGYKNVTQTLDDHLNDDERSIISIGRQGDTNIITESGVFALVLTRKVNELLERLGFQENIAGLWQPTDDGEVYAVMLDTNKRHSDGTPVRQLKWDSDILDVLQEEIDV